MPARAISRLAAMTATTLSIDGTGSSPTVAERTVQRPPGDPQARVHEADLALHDGVVGLGRAGHGGDGMVAGRLGDAEVDRGDRQAGRC